ncbi:hypothetical protein OS493_001003 [Desmophyllum pertusum]|uniref:Uncharacterized protein n=1 Tax=Desmophyllum pertusum TaxID=174260 RepID=A0A9W9ZUE3_9CNID|nr:hypothetical protein OS493_001003 [Desmophyllum pertusum]
MTYKNVSYYADSFSDADYGNTHLAVLAANGDAVSVTTTINMRFGCKYRSMPQESSTTMRWQILTLPITI